MGSQRVGHDLVTSLYNTGNYTQYSVMAHMGEKLRVEKKKKKTGETKET